MSRPESNSPETSPALPRRSLLKAIAAAPTAVTAATGQAFSQNSPIATDRRFAKVDHMIRKINETCVAQSEAARDEGKLDDDGNNIFKSLNDKWYDAQKALEKYADRVAGNPNPTATDALVLAKIADFQIVNQGGDVDIENQERCVPKALRAMLLANGITPTEKTAMTIAQDEIEKEIAARPPRPPRPSSSVNAGKLILKARAVGKAHDAAMRFEASIEDDTPQSERAIAVTDQRRAELEALRDEIIIGIRTSDPRAEDRPYSMTGYDIFTVYCELLTAICPWFWDEDRHGGFLLPVFQAMRKLSEGRSEDCVDDAQRWNAVHGGANV